MQGRTSAPCECVKCKKVMPKMKMVVIAARKGYMNGRFIMHLCDECYLDLCAQYGVDPRREDIGC